jgi:hypothetical protein
MTTPYENFVNIALGKALSSDVTLPTANEIPVFTGIGRQVTGKTIAELGLASKDIVYIPNSTDPFTLETNTQYMIGDFITTTYGDLYLQLPALTASTIIEIQLALNIEEVGHVFITPSGTDLVFGQGTPVDLKPLPLVPGCTVKLFFHSVGTGWIGQANYSDHFIDPVIHPFNATSWTSVGHRIVSESTVVCNLTIPDGSINLGDPITFLSFDRETSVLTAMRVDGTETTIPLNAFGGTRLANLSSPATVLTANGHYLFYSNTGSYYTVICELVLPTTPDDTTYVRISNIGSLNSFATGAGATITPGGSDKINGIAAALDLTDYLVNYRSAVITFTYSSSSANWTVSVLGDLIKPGNIAIYDADKTNTTTLTPVTDLTANRVITLPDADVDLGKLTNSTVAPSDITVTASPFTYQNTTAFNGDVIISGGTVSNIEFTRDNTTFYAVGFIEGVLRLSPSDRVRVTYTVAPTMTLVPR